MYAGAQVCLYLSSSEAASEYFNILSLMILLAFNYFSVSTIYLCVLQIGLVVAIYKGSLSDGDTRVYIPTGYFHTTTTE